MLEIVSSVRDRNCCFDFKSSLLPQNHKKALFVCHNLDCGKKKKKGTEGDDLGDSLISNVSQTHHPEFTLDTCGEQTSDI